MWMAMKRFSGLAVLGSALCGVGCGDGEIKGRTENVLELKLVACDSSPNQIRGCIGASGLLRVLSGTEQCRTPEEPICWNQVSSAGSATLVSVSELPESTSACAAGGSRLSVGTDLDADGQLDAVEITAFANVCHGTDGTDGVSCWDLNANGACDLSSEDSDENGVCDPGDCQGASGLDGLNSLTVTATEAAGEHCASGGVRIAAGLDVNKDGVLDDAEISQTTYLCGGSTPTASLVAIDPELAGEKCSNGGVRIRTGTDLTGDGGLSMSETTRSAYVCHGSIDDFSIIVVQTEAPGTNCALGGRRTQLAYDVDRDGVLSPAEVVGTWYSCTGEEKPIAEDCLAGCHNLVSNECTIFSDIIDCGAKCSDALGLPTGACAAHVEALFECWGGIDFRAVGCPSLSGLRQFTLNPAVCYDETRRLNACWAGRICLAGETEWPKGSGSCIEDPCLPDPCTVDARTSCIATGVGAHECRCPEGYGWNGAACAVTCLDRDGDGFGVGPECAVIDCDDNDAWIAPNQPEDCDGFDNDCDGAVDEASDLPYMSYQGVCAILTSTCMSGLWQDPDFTSVPSYEMTEISCDGLDNDCDGMVDEELEPAFSTYPGVCAAVSPLCDGGAWQTPLFSELAEYEGVEISCDGLDNDCDGEVDEGC